MDQRKWMRLILRLLSLLTLSYGVTTSDDIHVESKCFAPTYLELDCDSSSDSVISIIWNATFFGQSECGSPNSCCPDDTDCTVLVMEVDNWHDDHLEQLKACNGETTCSVRVTRIDHVCPAATDYETVTYQCVPPEISSTAATLGPTIHGQTDRWTNTGRNQTTSPETEYTGIQTDRPVSQTTHGNGVSDEYSCNTYIDAIIGVSVSLSLLLVLIALVSGYVCYKRGFAAGGGNKQNLTNMISNDEYLTTIFPSDTSTGVDKESEVDHNPNAIRQSSQVYESYEGLETVYLCWLKTTSV